jgi:hypothetical protein
VTGPYESDRLSSRITDPMKLRGCDDILPGIRESIAFRNSLQGCPAGTDGEILCGTIMVSRTLNR